MGLDPEVLERLVAFTRRRYPHWSGFADPDFEREERDYKLEAIEGAIGADGLLLERSLREDLEGRAYPSFLDRFLRLGKQTNLLYLRIPRSSDLWPLYQAKDGLVDAAGVCSALLDLVWGNGSSPARIERFVGYCSTHGMRCTWPLATYFLFMTRPGDDVFVKPRLFRRIANVLETPWALKGGPSADEYALFQKWCHDLLDSAKPLGARDMVDIESLLWVAGGEMSSSAQGTREVTSAGVGGQSPAELAAPFDRIFADMNEAESALELMADAVRSLGVTSDDDERYAVTVRQEGQLTLDFAGWCILRWGPADKDERLQIVLPVDNQLSGSLRETFRFKATVAGRAQGLFGLGPAALSAEIRSAFLEATTQIGKAFDRHRVSAQRKYHRAEIGAALIDPDRRSLLLAHGLAAPDASDQPAFTEAARDLLVAMEADPTKAFYTAHRQSLAEHVQEPVKALLGNVADLVRPQLRDALETEKRLFGVFTKNDYGRGGAWPFYWGAFYPHGGTKTSDCQLFVTLKASGLSYGFSIGDYASDDRKRFDSNVKEQRLSLAAALSRTIDSPEFRFGEANESEGSRGTSAPPGLDLAGWFSVIDSSGPQASVHIPWEELLATDAATVTTRVTDVFDRLFPLVLLGILDDPLPAIHEYLGTAAERLGDQQEMNPVYSMDDLVAETSLPRESLESWLRAVERKGQAILYGPPGTGKTYVAERLAKYLVSGGRGVMELVQFHPAYAYEDFMQGIRPKARDGGGLDYPVVDGRFKQFCQEARERKGTSVLVIDEINRANLSRVFGELMYLLEYRDKSIPLAAGGTFSIPGNVRIIGTMNTADRSIALVDHALRRRFAFLALYPDYQMLTDFHAKAGGGFDPAKLIEVLRDLNRKIGDHHYEVGTSFFLRPDIEEQLPDVWRMEIEPYLEEYFFDQQATVDSYRWDEVKKKLELD